MAVPVFSTRFLNGHNSTGGPSYVVPSGFLAVLRDFDVVTPATSGLSVVLVVATAVVYLLELGITPTLEHNQWQGRAVVNEGEVVTVEATDPVDFQLSGYLLTLP